MRLFAYPSACIVIVPVSISDPAVRVAVPVRVTSVIGLPPVSATSALAASAMACGSLVVAVGVGATGCWASAGTENNETSRRDTQGRMELVPLLPPRIACKELNAEVYTATYDPVNTVKYLVP